MVLQRLTDRLVLRPTRGAIEAEHKTRHVLPLGEGEVELWRHRSGPEEAARPDLVVLKFCGTGGRAERATEHPANFWPDLHADVWALNPPGYGGSSGRASLRGMADVTVRAYRHVRSAAGDLPLLVTGNSLGCVAALYLAAHEPVDALLLRNSPPLRELIIDRFGWWNLWIAANLVARQIPPELDAIVNAGRCRTPALFISSQRDRVVWPRHQELIMDAYGGEKRVMRLPDADHDALIEESELDEYLELLEWLRERLFRKGA